VVDSTAVEAEASTVEVVASMEVVVSTAVAVYTVGVGSAVAVASTVAAALPGEPGAEAIAADLAVTTEDGVAIAEATAGAATAVGAEAPGDGDTLGGAGVLTSASRPIGVGAMDTLMLMDIRLIIPTTLTTRT
jgi:hypothetical protein